MGILEKINSPADLRGVPELDLPVLCGEIRQFLITSLAKTGGHLASNLGAVELTVALDRVYDPSSDRIVFDVGHQCYTHKMLTGRRDEFSGLRQFGGISGFPKPNESDCDAFMAGHASNSISVALGMARARTKLKENYDVVAVIGDGALTGGLAYEGLSNAGQSGEPIVVILNDNAMSINSNVGGMSRLLSRMRVKPQYFEFKRFYRGTVGKIKPIYNFFHRVKEDVKDAILPDNMFDDLGFYYLGPVDGHDVSALESAMVWACEMRVPVLLHVVTKKGKGYPFAELHPEKYHGVGQYNPQSGVLKKSSRSFSNVFGQTLCALARDDERITAITAAMESGTGLDDFASALPDRCYDVGIAEGHAISMAAGMAKQGLIPVAAIYSSFLQRAFDMLIHDVALQGLHVVFGVDRAGLVGEDGETHHGVFDIAYLSAVPGMTIWCPASFAEMHDMLRHAIYEENGPVALRYPRGGEGKYNKGGSDSSTVCREGADVTLVSYGTMINESLAAAELLSAEDISVEVIKLGRVMPLDAEPVLRSLERTCKLVVAEEVCDAGCVGRQLLAAASGMAIKSRLINLGTGIVTQGGTAKLRELNSLDAEGIAQKIRELM